MQWHRVGCCGKVLVYNNILNTENIVSNKGQLLQDPSSMLSPRACPSFHLSRQRHQASRTNQSFDQYVVLLRNTVTQMVYKHAISTIVPGRAVNFSTNETLDAVDGSNA